MNGKKERNRYTKMEAVNNYGGAIIKQLAERIGKK